MAFELKGTLLEKKIYEYDPKVSCTQEEFEKMINHFIKKELIASLAILSSKVFLLDDGIFHFRSIPITVDFIDFVLLKSIQATEKNEQHKKITEVELEDFLKYAYYIYENTSIPKSGNPDELIVIISYRQFLQQERHIQWIGRYLVLFEKIWKPYKDDFNVEVAIKELTGLNYNQLILITYYLIAQEKPFFNDLKSFIAGLKEATPEIVFNETDIERYLNWAGASLEYFEKYDGILFDPIVKYPILRPEPKTMDLNVILSKTYLFFKLSYGMYFELIDFSKGERSKNPFKVTFGYVFQDYIGHLLKKYIKRWEIIEEIKYKKKGNEIDSVDWFVKRGNDLLLIEVKQSSIFQISKNTGSIDQLKDDLGKTLGKAIKQLNRSEEDILSLKYKELSRFKKIRNIEKIVITSDPFYNGNYLINQLFENNGFNNDIHVINIAEFELLLDAQKGHEILFHFIKEKRESGNMEVDFKEYIYKKYPKEKLRQGYLSEVAKKKVDEIRRKTI